MSVGQLVVCQLRSQLKIVPDKSSLDTRNLFSCIMTTALTKQSFVILFAQPWDVDITHGHY
uniref:Uncharacterized protein n=1 Tax=Arundo donax TaxID=35708 RepID=A0A0A9BHT9_ARUDO